MGTYLCKTSIEINMGTCYNEERKIRTIKKCFYNSKKEGKSSNDLR